MNRDNDMNHLKGAMRLQAELAAGKAPRGMYGDSVGGWSFTDENARALEVASLKARGDAGGWRSVYAGPGTTKWQIIDCSPMSACEQAIYDEAKMLSELP